MTTISFTRLQESFQKNSIVTNQVEANARNRGRGPIPQSNHLSRARLGSYNNRLAMSNMEGIRFNRVSQASIDNSNDPSHCTRLKERAKTYIECGLSVIPTRADKSPYFKWKAFQNKKMSLEEINKYFSDQRAMGLGVVCGKVSGNLEVIDVDVKYDDEGFIEESYIGDLKASIESYDKLLIIRTMNKGLHIYYRCKSIEGNQKLANNSKGQVIIETRGEGGYVLAPPSSCYHILQGDFSSIPEITEEERSAIISLAKSYDYELSSDISDSYNEEYQINVTPFDDYNQNGEVPQLLEKHGWAQTLVTSDKIFYRRPGKTDNGSSANWHIHKRIFYVFTTSTIFEANRGYNPVQVFAILECDNDYSQTSRKLYDLGFGDRHTNFNKTKVIKAANATDTPQLSTQGFPLKIQEFISACVDAFQTPKDYWIGSVLTTIALAIGDKLELETNYNNVPILWTCIVGEVSSGKTEPLKFCLKPIFDLDQEAISQYLEKKKAFNRDSKRSQNDDFKETMEEPQYKQYIISDYTPEALVETHGKNPRGMLIYRDEIKAFLDDFGRYNNSGEQSNMLSTFSRVPVTYNRISSDPIAIPKPTILLAGGIQPDLLPTLAKDDRSENGFLSRMCFVYPDSSPKPPLSRKQVPSEIMLSWTNFIYFLINREEKKTLLLDDDAWNVYYNWYESNRELTDNTPTSYLKGVYGKLDIIFLRVAIIIKGMNMFFEGDNTVVITADTMRIALDITEYFRATAQKVYDRIFSQKPRDITEREAAQYLLKLGHNKSNIARILGKHRQQVQRYTK